MKKLIKFLLHLTIFLISAIYFIFCIPFTMIALIGKLLVKIGDIRNLMNIPVEKIVTRLYNIIFFIIKTEK